MSKPKLTPWYPPHKPPVRVGDYEVSDLREGDKSHWTGYLWTAPWGKDANDTTIGFCKNRLSNKMYCWRGLTEQSK